MKTNNCHFKIPAVLIICLSMFSLTGFSQEKKTMTITGEVLDMACYMASGAQGEGHKSCASSCINSGSPMGVLTSDGKVYLLVENHDKKDAYAAAKKYAGEQITVTGTFSDRGGINGLVVNEVKPKG